MAIPTLTLQRYSIQLRHHDPTILQNQKIEDQLLVQAI
jgi:hypothetical protein